MVDAHWDDLRGKRVRYTGDEWELTGDVEMLEQGDTLALDASRPDDTTREAARLIFDVENPPASLNPGGLGDHFDRLEREGDGTYLVVGTAGRRYRYELRRLELG